MKRRYTSRTPLLPTKQLTPSYNCTSSSPTSYCSCGYRLSSPPYFRRVLCPSSLLILLLLVIARTGAFVPFRFPDKHSSRRSILHLSPKSRTAPSRRDSLRWVIQSVQRYPHISLNPNLIAVLKLLQEARTPRQVSDAGRLLQISDIPNSVDIKERLVKVLSIAGLLDTAQQLMEDLLQQQHLPSSIAYVAYLQGLRQGGRIQRMESTLDQLRDVATAKQEQISVLALNTYLAALLDDQGDRLENVKSILSSCQSRWNIALDATSFATVMNLSSRPLVDQLWQELVRLGIEPTLYCYHARLKVATTNEEALAILNEIISVFQPDRYTIDLVILPLARTGKTQDLATMLETFTDQKQDDEMLSSAFAAFLTTLCRAGEMASAQIVFDKFLKVRASTRHYNIMISGYKNIFDKDGDQGIRGKAIEMYRRLIEAGFRPDKYTLTSMTGFALDEKELTELMRVGLIECEVDVTDAVLRAAISAYGNLRDISSACWMFEMFPNGDVRTWNALMGAFAKCGDGSTLIQARSSEAARVLEQELMVVGGGNVISQNLKFSLATHIDSLSAPDAARIVLDLMNKQISGKGVGVRAPRPNSQTYALAAKALQYGNCNASVAIELFQNASRSGVPIDGRFVNGVFRLFGDDINGALTAWKSMIRRECIRDKRALDLTLVASYHGLLFVSGRALRPDIALQIVYAMQKEKVTPDETALNCYLAGKRQQVEMTPLKQSFGAKASIVDGIHFASQFESILSVECLKFDSMDKRREGEQRVRIIL